MALVTALIDGNNFYAACEQSIDPSLRDRPLVVLSNNDGCIIARSPEARGLGISMGTPYFKIRQKLQNLNVAIRSSNYTLYGDMSHRLMSLLENHCEDLEIYSIDEAFARLHRPNNNDLHPWARQLRALIYQNLGITIAIGIGTNKVQAKLANHLAKRMDLHAGIFDFIKVKNYDEELDRISVEDIWGIGYKMSSWCRQRGINSAKQFRDMPNNELRAKYGVIGTRLQRELHGEICLPFSNRPIKKKETCVSRSFNRPITDILELRQAISTYVVRACEKLRKQNQRAGSITIFARSSLYNSSFYSKSATTHLDMASNNTTEILAASLELTEQIFNSKQPLIKAGVIMRNLQSSNLLQKNLLINLDEKETRKNERLMQVVDKINQRYGRSTISWAICGTNQSWTMRRNALSPAATTDINEIPIAKAL